MTPFTRTLTVTLLGTFLVTGAAFAQSSTSTQGQPGQDIQSDTNAPAGSKGQDSSAQQGQSASPADQDTQSSTKHKAKKHHKKKSSEQNGSDTSGTSQ